MKKIAAACSVIIAVLLFMGIFSGCDRPQTDFDFSRFTMNCLGDSITYGFIPKKGDQMERPYPEQLKSYLGLKEVRNYGVSGATLAVNTANRLIISQSYEEMDDDAQIVSVLGGANDLRRNLPLGNINDTQNTTVYGALNVLATGLMRKYPNAFIFFMTPYKRGDKFPTVNEVGYTLQDVADAVKEVCAKYDIPVLDMYKDGRFEEEMNTAASDGLHPSQAFFEKYTVPQIAHFLEKHYDDLLAKTKKA